MTVRIKASGLGKCYRIKHAAQRTAYRRLSEEILHFAANPLKALRASARSTEEFWALKNVDFEVADGEVVGVIGHNGAGKSTLLKLLSRITEPSEGRIELNGRVASLLEVGTGFHPELTGRENIFLNGAILGMSRGEICNKFDEIVSFAEIERFLDTPVKRYSSGMYVRLAFAVAAHLEPEILIVDEVLAVGDAAFQKKCLGKMSAVAEQGRTVLFVSHNMAAVERLCGSAILLEKGSLIAQGGCDEIISQYTALTDSKSSERIWSGGTSNPAVDYFRVFAARCLGPNGDLRGEFRSCEDVTLQIDHESDVDIGMSRVGIKLRDSRGSVVFESYDTDEHDELRSNRVRGRFMSSCTIPANLLNAGHYMADIIAGVPGSHRNLCLEAEAIAFTISAAGAVGTQLVEERKGVIRPQLEWLHCAHQSDSAVASARVA